MENVKGAAEGPEKDKFTVTGNSTIASNTMRALKDPRSNIFLTVGPEKPETDAMEGFIYTHMAS